MSILVNVSDDGVFMTPVQITLLAFVMSIILKFQLELEFVTLYRTLNKPGVPILYVLPLNTKSETGANDADEKGIN
jgi:hypothetical protein